MEGNMLLLRVVLNTTTLYVVVYTILTSTNMFLRHWLRFSTGEPKESVGYRRKTDINTKGSTLCLDAILVAINQASEGGDKCWYTSTLELQLVSLDFCKACRSVLTLQVRVDSTTPRRLWASTATDASRVPSVQPFALTWTIPADGIRQISPAPKHMIVRQDFNEPLLGTAWPDPLQHLSLGGLFNQPIIEFCWPAYLQRLSFGASFNKPIVGVSWPASLQQLSFGRFFNQPIVRVVWPDSLQVLWFGEKFDQPILEVVWPASLQKLSFWGRFNQPIVGVAWPTSLRELSLEQEFNQPIVGVTWPASLQLLSFGYRFDQPIVGVVWPASLKQLSFGHIFGETIRGIAWPCPIVDRWWGGNFNQPIVGVVWPAALQELTFYGRFNQPIVGVAWPASLRFLTFGPNNFNQPILGVVWPVSLQEVVLGADFNQPTTGVVWPATPFQYVPYGPEFFNRKSRRLVRRDVRPACIGGIVRVLSTVAGVLLVTAWRGGPVLLSGCVFICILFGSSLLSPDERRGDVRASAPLLGG